MYTGILKKSTSSAFEGLEMDEHEYCGSQCSCSDSGGSCSCTDSEEPCKHSRDNITSSHQEQGEQEIPPPLEFDTNMYSSTAGGGQGHLQKTSVQVEINPCHQIITRQPEISPTDSEDMKYSAPEADQFYKNFTTTPYDKYSHCITHQQHHQQGGGADSATDSAIDMPGDGSVSTINEIPPHHSTMMSSSTGGGYHKHTPTIADYSDLHSADDSPNDSRSRAIAAGMHRPPPPKYLKHTQAHNNSQSKHSSTVKEQHPPVIYEYQRPPTNRTIDQSESIHLQTFPPSSNGVSREPYSSKQNGLDLSNTRLEESFTV